MPRYQFRNVETDEIVVEWVKMDDYDSFLAANPHLVREYNGAPGIGDPIRLGLQKPPEAFRDILRTVKKKHRNLLSGGTNINTF